MGFTVYSLFKNQIVALYSIVIMSRKKGTVIYLSEEDKAKLEKIAANWGVSQSSATQRLIREYKLD
jgi:hypothetical protein